MVGMGGKTSTKMDQKRHRQVRDSSFNLGDFVVEATVRLSYPKSPHSNNRRGVTDENQRPKQATRGLSLEELRAGIQSLGQLIDDLNSFDVNTIQHRADPKPKALTDRINSTLADIFGRTSAEHRDQYVWSLDANPVTISGVWHPLPEVRQGYQEGIRGAVTNLGTLRKSLEKRLQVVEGAGKPAPMQEDEDHPPLRKEKVSLLTLREKLKDETEWASDRIGERARRRERFRLGALERNAKGLDGQPLLQEPEAPLAFGPDGPARVFDEPGVSALGEEREPEAVQSVSSVEELEAVILAMESGTAEDQHIKVSPETGKASTAIEAAGEVVISDRPANAIIGKRGIDNVEESTHASDLTFASGSDPEAAICEKLPSVGHADWTEQQFSTGTVRAVGPDETETIVSSHDDAPQPQGQTIITPCHLDGQPDHPKDPILDNPLPHEGLSPSSDERVLVIDGDKDLSEEAALLQAITHESSNSDGLGREEAPPPQAMVPSPPPGSENAIHESVLLEALEVKLNQLAANHLAPEGADIGLATPAVDEVLVIDGDEELSKEPALLAILDKDPSALETDGGSSEVLTLQGYEDGPELMTGQIAEEAEYSTFTLGHAELVQAGERPAVFEEEPTETGSQFTSDSSSAIMNNEQRDSAGHSGGSIEAATWVETHRYEIKGFWVKPELLYPPHSLFDRSIIPASKVASDIEWEPVKPLRDRVQVGLPLQFLSEGPADLRVHGPAAIVLDIAGNRGIPLVPTTNQLRPKPSIALPPDTSLLKSLQERLSGFFRGVRLLEKTDTRLPSPTIQGVSVLDGDGDRGRESILEPLERFLSAMEAHIVQDHYPQPRVYRGPMLALTPGQPAEALAAPSTREPIPSESTEEALGRLVLGERNSEIERAGLIMSADVERLSTVEGEGPVTDIVPFGLIGEKVDAYKDHGHPASRLEGTSVFWKRRWPLITEYGHLANEEPLDQGIYENVHAELPAPIQDAHRSQQLQQPALPAEELLTNGPIFHVDLQEISDPDESKDLQLETPEPGPAIAADHRVLSEDEAEATRAEILLVEYMVHEQEMPEGVATVEENLPDDAEAGIKEQETEGLRVDLDHHQPSQEPLEEDAREEVSVSNHEDTLSGLAALVEGETEKKPKEAGKAGEVFSAAQKIGTGPENVRPDQVFNKGLFHKVFVDEKPEKLVRGPGGDQASPKDPAVVLYAQPVEGAVPEPSSGALRGSQSHEGAEDRISLPEGEHLPFGNKAEEEPTGDIILARPSENPNPLDQARVQGQERQTQAEDSAELREAHIRELKGRIEELRCFDASTISQRFDPRTKALSEKVNGTVAAIFGRNAPAYWQHAMPSLDTLPVVVGGPRLSTQEIRSAYGKGIEKAIDKLTRTIEGIERGDINVLGPKPRHAQPAMRTDSPAFPGTIRVLGESARLDDRTHSQSSRDLKEDSLSIAGEDEMGTHIRELKDRIEELRCFDASTISQRFDPRTKTLSEKVNGTVAAIFGRNTPAYWQHAMPSLDTLPVVVGGPRLSTQEIRSAYRKAIEKAIDKLAITLEILRKGVAGNPCRDTEDKWGSAATH
jgi:hypothetical protein